MVDDGHVPTALRPSRQEIDAEIVDRAAALFARHGFAQTSLQAVADAVGYSKAGLLHHFSSKEALHQAAQSLSRAQAQAVLDRVRRLPLGPERDRRAIEELVDVALTSPGLTALNLSHVPSLGAALPDFRQGDDGGLVLEIFGVDLGDRNPARLIRVVSALAALSVVALVADHIADCGADSVAHHDPDHGATAAAWRNHIVAASFDALGHRRPGASHSDIDHVEA
jgi:AcrR family transcriptional regulator